MCRRCQGGAARAGPRPAPTLPSARYAERTCERRSPAARAAHNNATQRLASATTAANLYLLPEASSRHQPVFMKTLSRTNFFLAVASAATLLIGVASVALYL